MKSSECTCSSGVDGGISSDSPCDKRDSKRQRTKYTNDEEYLNSLDCKSLPLDLVLYLLEFYELYIDRWEHLIIYSVKDGRNTRRIRQDTMMRFMFGYFSKDQERKVHLIFKYVLICWRWQHHSYVVQFKDLRALRTTCGHLLYPENFELITRQNPSLQTLYGVLCDDETAEKVVKQQKLQEFKSLTFEDDDETQLSAKGITTIVKAYTSLQRLHLLGHTIGDEGAVSIAKYLPYLKVLTLNSCDIADKGAEALFTHRTVEHLILKGNNFKARGLAFLENCTQLKVLNLDSNSFPIEDQSIAIMNQLVNLEELSLNDCGLTSSSLAVLAQNNTIKSVKIGDNKYPERALAELKTMQKLSALSLRDQSTLTSAGITNFVSLLVNLSKLDLSFDSGVDDAALPALASMPRLSSLTLKETGISDSGLVHLIPNRTIKSLDLSCNTLSGTILHQLVIRNNTIQKLSLQAVKCPLIDRVVHDLLQLNTSIDYLNLEKTAITDEGLKTLPQNTTLTNLNLQYSKYITDVTALNILRSNTSLTNLSVRFCENISSRARQEILQHCTWIQWCITDLITEAPQLQQFQPLIVQPPFQDKIPPQTV